MSELITCPICQDDTSEYVVTDCSHNFHADCLNSWLKNNNNCPICRKAITNYVCAMKDCNCKNIGRFYESTWRNCRLYHDPIEIKGDYFCEKHLYDKITLGNYKSTLSAYKINYEGEMHYFFDGASNNKKVSVRTVAREFEQLRYTRRDFMERGNKKSYLYQLAKLLSMRDEIDNKKKEIIKLESLFEGFHINI